MKAPLNFRGDPNTASATALGRFTTSSGGHEGKEAHQYSTTDPGWHDTPEGRYRREMDSIFRERRLLAMGWGVWWFIAVMFAFWVLSSS